MRSIKLVERAQRGEYDDGASNLQPKKYIIETFYLFIIFIGLIYFLELILEQLARNRVFLTDSRLEKLRSAFVIVVGCGGVGSHCISALARSGVSFIRVIDFDQVTLSSLNRHAVATLADVGTPKVVCLKKRLNQVAPWVEFDVRNELYCAETSRSLLGDWNGRKPDFIVDAIDNIDSKVALLKYCYENHLPVISSMGAGAKSDPTRIFVGDISTSTDDPLSRVTRRKLRASGIKSGILVVFSTEKPSPEKAQLLPLPEDEFIKGSVGELGVLPDFRVRILPVLGTMPAVFGYTLANHIILQITGYPNEYILAKSRDKMYENIHSLLQAAEEKLARTSMPGEDVRGLRIPVTTADVGYLVDEVFKGRSAKSGLSTRLTLVRWQKPYGPVVDRTVPDQISSRLSLIDLVCLTKEEGYVHTSKILEGQGSLQDLYDEETILRVERRFKEELAYNQYR